MEQELIEKAKKHLRAIATDTELNHKRDINQVIIGLQAVKDLMTIVLSDDQSDESKSFKQDVDSFCESVNEMLCDLGELFECENHEFSLSRKYMIMENVDADIDSVCRNVSAIIKGIYYLVR